MLPIGIIRHVDELGRVVIPMEMRKQLNIQEHDALEMYKDNDDILVKKYDKKNVKENSTIIRNIDELGRLVVPKEWRNLLELKTGDLIEVSLHSEKIRFRKHLPYCIFCGNSVKLIDYQSKKVCVSCIKKLENAKKMMLSQTSL